MAAAVNNELLEKLFVIEAVQNIPSVIPGLKFLFW